MARSASKGNVAVRGDNGGGKRGARRGEGSHHFWKTCMGYYKAKLGPTPSEAKEGQGLLQCYLHTNHPLIASLMDSVDVAQLVQVEEHLVQMASLERVDYFQSQLLERLVVVSRDKTNPLTM